MVRFQHGSNPGQLHIQIRRILRQDVQSLKGKRNLRNLRLRVRKSLVHNSRLKLRAKQAHIQNQHGNIRRKPQLAHFQNIIARMGRIVQLPLRPIHPEPDGAPILVNNPVQVIQPGGRIGKKPFQHIRLIRRQRSIICIHKGTMPRAPTPRYIGNPTI